MQPLKQYLSAHDIKQAAFARRVEISRSFLNDLIAGRRTPGLALAKRISDATDGAVPMTYWVAESHDNPHGERSERRKGAMQ